MTPDHRRTLALGIAPAALAACGGWMRAVRGPSWLAFNFDPTYAYLLNSVSILQGHAPYLIQHPGVPLQTIGSVVIALRHAVDGHGTLAEDVVARPEIFVAWIYWTAIAVSAALLAAAGVIVWRRSWLGAALLVQSSAWLSVTAIVLAGQMRAEALIVGVAAIWAALIVAHVERPAPSTAVWLGAATGVVLCLHLSALPLIVAPLMFLDGRRDRVRFVVATTAGFLVAFLPAILKLASFAKYVVTLSLGSGLYGTGPMTVVNSRLYGPALWLLLGAEPVVTVTIAVSAAVWIAWSLGTAPDDSVRRARRGLGALVATDLACLLLSAKHPDVHYLVPMMCTLGANLWLIARYLGAVAPVLRRPAAAVGLVVIAASEIAGLRAAAGHVESARIEQERAGREIAQSVGERRCFAITAYRASAEQEALQWGNITAEYRGRPMFGREIADRFPRAAFDMGGLAVRDAHWQPVDLDALLRREPCVVYAGETHFPPPASSRVTVEMIAEAGREGLYRIRAAQ